MSIQANVEAIYRQLPAERTVRVVGVSKYATLAQMQDAFDAGLREFGENKVQDAARKMAELPSPMVSTCRWHLLGHLQKNKARKAVSLGFALIHSVDSLALAELLSELSIERGTRQSVLLQLNLTREPQKSGFLLETLRQDYPRILALPGIMVAGLMTMGPHGADHAASKSVFCRLRDLRDDLVAACGHPLPELSMGMSDDYAHALECGATIIRIGNRIFGPAG